MFEFREFDNLSCRELTLVLTSTAPANEEKGYVPAYYFDITLNGKTIIGKIDIRIGTNENTYYGGHIGYGIFPDYRGNKYAAKACRIVRRVAIAHGMEHVTITCNPDNLASRKTIERLGARLLEIVDLPRDNEMFKMGETQKCRYHWQLT